MLTRAMYQRGISHSDKTDLSAKQKFANTNGTLKLNETNGTESVSTRVLYNGDIILVERYLYELNMYIVYPLPRSVP